MSKGFFALLLSIAFALINTKTIPTNDLKSALNQAVPGDIIELKSGTYTGAPFGLKSGTAGKLITIRPATGAQVMFSGTQTSCIFDSYGISYLKLEGPMELKNAFCGVKVMNANYVNITGLKIHDTQEHGIVVSGHNNHIYNNEVYNCVMNNKATAKTKSYGWSQCVAVWGTGNGAFSTNIIFENNYIHEGYGEGLDFLECDNCKALKNNITNGFSMNIYIDASKNIVVDGNVLRVNTNNYDTQWGRACGIGMAPESGSTPIDNILITNNIIIGTRMGIYFFTMDRGGTYNKVKILHNTIWKTSASPVWFRQPTTGTPSVCEMKNNFFYVDYVNEFIPKNSWSLGYNLYYNTYNVPSIYSDSTSMAAQTLDIGSIFNKVSGCSDYNNHNLDIKCLRPSKSPGKFKLYHGGIAPNNKVTLDYSGETRSTSKPSIGAFENQESGGSPGPDPDPEPTGDIQVDVYDVKFKINYCVSGSVIKLVGSLNNWNVGNAITMNSEGNCVWSTTLSEGTKKSFTYKFVVANGSSASRWENDPNRVFDGESLALTASSSSSGSYQNCSYSKSGKLITLTCLWK